MSENPAVPPESPVLLIDVKEVGRLLGICERTVWRLNSACKLPKPIAVGSKTKKWKSLEIAEWVDAGCPARKVWEQRDGRTSS
jgi:predicted DNA-binding transcriptional regulator AlpA